MATTKQETVNLVDIFKDFKDNKSIDKQTLITVLEWLLLLLIILS